MKVTRLQTTKVEKGEGSRMVGIARVVLDNAFAINDIRIIDGGDTKGLFIAFPSRKTSDGKFMDVCHPINAETRKIIADAVLEDFNKWFGMLFVE